MIPKKRHLQSTVKQQHVAQAYDLPGAGEAQIITLAANLTLTDADYGVDLTIDPGGASRNVTLPAEGEANHIYIIHSAADAAENLVFKDDAGNTIVTVGEDQNAFIWPDGVSWFGGLFGMSFSDAAGDPSNVAANASDGVGIYPSRWDHAHAGNPVSLDVVTAETSCTNRVDEVTVYTFTVPANTLATANLLRFEMFYYYLNNGGINTMTIKIKYGATVLATIAHAPGQSATPSYGHIRGNLKANAATNAQTFDYSDVFYLVGTTPSSANGEGTAAIDSTGAQAFSVTVQHSLNNAATTFTTRTTSLELMKAL